MGCAGLLLTGGSSRRLGTDKATLVLDGETLAVRAARVLMGNCDPVIEVGAGVSGLPSVREMPAGAGPLAALVAGATALAPLGVRYGAVLLGCDLPFTAPVVAAIVGASPDMTVVPTDASGRDQYVCARYSSAALTLAGDLVAAGEHSLQALVAGLPPESVVRLAGFGASAFDDVDAPGDALRLGIDLPR